MATALNNLALAFVAAGVLAPVVTGQLRTPGATLVVLVWIGLGAALNIIAQFVLGSLRGTWDQAVHWLLIPTMVVLIVGVGALRGSCYPP
jgi:hypothetical protein